MPTNHRMDNVDITKDYYQVLGLPDTATVEDLKAAYISLAMQYHPDTKTKEFDKSLLKAHQTQFVQVAEAYSVLSKPELKRFYDTRRSLLLGRNIGSASVVQAAADAASGEDRKIVSESYNTQRMNFSKVQGRASSNWRDLQDKYKTEKWQNMSIPQRKLHRSAKVYGVGSSMFKMIVPAAFLAGLTYTIFLMGK